MKWFIVGRDYGGDFGCGGVFVIENLDGCWSTPPTRHTREPTGSAMPLIEKYYSYDITDDDDPELGTKGADLRRRRYENDPELVGLVGTLPRF